VSFSVNNAGSLDGAEVAQVYVRPVAPKVERPFQELKGFKKLRLKAGESGQVELVLNSRAFSYWDTKAQAWKTDAGTYEIRVGSSSRDIRLNQEWVLK
jgi:beta-glucosidase